MRTKASSVRLRTGRLSQSARIDARLAEEVHHKSALRVLPSDDAQPACADAALRCAAEGAAFLASALDRKAGGVCGRA
eukprot:206268-Pleurochrysis_carterae.AAC.1